MNLPPEYSLWVEFGVVLTIASVAVLAAALVAERWIASAAWRRTIWRAAAVGLLVMLGVELTGIGRGIGQLLVVGLSEAVSSEREWSNEQKKMPGDSGPFIRVADGKDRSSEVSQTSVSAHGGMGRPAVDLMREGEVDAKPGATVVADLPASEERNWFAAHDLGGVRRLDDPAQTRAEAMLVGPVIRSGLGSFDRLDSSCDSADEPASVGKPLRFDGTVRSETRNARVTGELAAVAASSGPFESVEQTSVVPPAWPVVVWSLGCLFVLSYVLTGQALLWVFRWRHRESPGLAVRSRAERLARRLGVRRPVCVVESPRLRTPVAFGVFAPTVVLPSGFADDFDANEQDAMLVHEMAHLAAGDPAWQLAVNLLCSLLWWQPLVWLLRHRLRMASETAADEASLIVPQGPEHLASCLVAMGRRLVDAPRLGWLPMTGDGYRSNLGRRVTRLLGLGRKTWRAPRRTRAAIVKGLIVVMLVTAMVTCTAWVRPRAARAEGESTMKQLKVTWTESLAAATLVAVLGTLSGDTLADTPEADDAFTPYGAVVALLQDDEEGEREGEARREREREERGEGDRAEERHQERERAERENIERELHELERAREELGRHAEELERKLRELPDDADEAAREIQERLEHVGREARKVEERMHDIREGRRGEERGEDFERPEHPEEIVHRLMQQREELMARARELQEAMKNATREGHRDAAHEIEEKLGGIKREFEAIERKIHEIREEFGPRERPRDEGGPREEIERRLHHLRAAAENLHAAGMHDQAEQLMRHAENLMRQMQGPRREGERERPREMDREPPRPEHREGPPPQELERAVRDMHRQMEEMRGQMEEMRHVLKMLMERERRDER